ncbi:MAG TPA: adenosylcobinamide-phosphate synthase CbiB [Dictyobacter sp.]|nr:adenosylcobinamide-phosphate synthase CbiB [Dictyobacter sp.]
MVDMMATQRMKRKLTCWAALSVLVAWGLDHLGEPPAAWHPVVWYGWLIRRLEAFVPQQKYAQLGYGAGMLGIAGCLIFFPALLVQKVLIRVERSADQHRFWLMRGILALIAGGLLKPFVALRMLADAGKVVREALEQQDLEEARQALRSLVSRDRSQLTEQQIAAAAIESLAENLSDSIAAPLFYYALLGLPGAACYRLYNTFDSMIGYHGQYEYTGKAAAKLDDLLNFIPARLTALLLICCAPLYGGDRRNAWYVWRRDARKTESPNAGHPMSAMAGALHVRLVKIGHYTLGDAEQPLRPEHIQQAEKMVHRIGGLLFLLTALWRIVWSARS